MALEVRGASGEGFATIAADGCVLDSWFLQPQLASTDKTATMRLPKLEIARSLGKSADGYARHDDIRDVDVVAILTEIGSLASAPMAVDDASRRLHLLTHRLVQPNRLNLDGIFSLLPTNAWTTLGPCECSRVAEARMEAPKHRHSFFGS